MQRLALFLAAVSRLAMAALSGLAPAAAFGAPFVVVTEERKGDRVSLYEDGRSRPRSAEDSKGLEQLSGGGPVDSAK